MTLDNQTMALIAVGASVAANCRHCLEYNVGTALQCGTNNQQIAEAVEIGRRVRLGAAAKIDKFASILDIEIGLSKSALDGACECDPLSKAQQVKNG
jgi:AhpD family alkylhydroperoxidase